MIFWLIWIATGFGYETWALVSGRYRDTLSEQVWHFEGHGWTVTRYFVSVFMLWLTIHLIFKVLR